MPVRLFSDYLETVVLQLESRLFFNGTVPAFAADEYKVEIDPLALDFLN
jgi:hypothetical protein